MPGGCMYDCMYRRYGNKRIISRVNINLCFFHGLINLNFPPVTIHSDVCGSHFKNLNRRNYKSLIGIDNAVYACERHERKSFPNYVNSYLISGIIFLQNVASYMSYTYICAHISTIYMSVCRRSDIRMAGIYSRSVSFMKIR